MDAGSVDWDAGAKDFKGGRGLALSAGAGGGEARNDGVVVIRMGGEPQGAKALEELGVTGQPVKAERRCERKFFHMQTHGKHPGKLEEGFSGCGVEAAGNNLDHGVLDSLQHVEEAFRAMGSVP